MRRRMAPDRTHAIHDGRVNTQGPLSYRTRVALRGNELEARRAARAPLSKGERALALENDRLRGELLAASAQLEAAHASIEDSAATHQEELERLRCDLEGTKHALVMLTGSVSWRLTRPLRALRRLVR